VNSGNDNLPPSLPPAKGNTPKPNPTSDSRRRARRAKQSGQKDARQEPELPEIKSQPRPIPIPPTSPPLPPKPDSFAQQPKPAEPARSLPKRLYPLRFVITLLSLLILGLLGFGSFLIVSPDGRSIKLYTEPTPDRLDLLKQSSRPIPADPAAKPDMGIQKAKGQKT
jgi:hypothetical protein